MLVIQEQPQYLMAVLLLEMCSAAPGLPAQLLVWWMWLRSSTLSVCPRKGCLQPHWQHLAFRLDCCAWGQLV